MILPTLHLSGDYSRQEFTTACCSEAIAKPIRLRIGSPHDRGTDCAITRDHTAWAHDERSYVALVVDDGEGFFYLAMGCAVEITTRETLRVITNPHLYYFSTALKLHFRIKKAMALGQGGE